MIVSDSPKRTNSRWLQMCVAVFAMIVLPLGIASAQDYEAVERRLGEGVSKGELSLEQAVIMMDALRKASAPKKEILKSKSDKVAKEQDVARKPIVKGKGDSEVEAAWKKLEAMVKAGEITKEQAAAKMAAIKGQGAKKEGVKKEPVKAKGDSDMEAMRKKLEAMVKAGEITKEQAAAKMAVIKGQGAKKEAVKKDGAKKEQESDRVMAYLMKVKEGLGVAVEAGRISKEEAVKRFEAAKKEIKERMAGQSDRGSGNDVDWERIKARIEGAVIRGDMTREEADAKYKEIRKQMAERGQQ